ncbi:hypothetical protein [Streptomyces nodosus]
MAFGSRHHIRTDYDGHGWWKWRCSCGRLGSARSSSDAWRQAQKHTRTK